MLEVLDKAGQVMLDLTGGDDLPPAFRHGTELLIFLAFTLHAIMEEKAKLLASEADEPDEE